MNQAAVRKFQYNPRDIIMHNNMRDYSIYEAANIFDRLYANITDTFLLGVISELSQMFVEVYISKFVHTIYIWPLSIAVYIFVFTSYYLIPMKIYGATLGKRAFNLKVVPMDNSEGLSYWKIFLREMLGKAISYSLFFLGFLLGALRPDGRTLHDFLAGTRVVKLK